MTYRALADRGLALQDGAGHRAQDQVYQAVTRHPTAEWLAQQIVQSFPWDTVPTYLVRDNDGAYGHAFASRVRAMGIRDRPTGQVLTVYSHYYTYCPNCWKWFGRLCSRFVLPASPTLREQVAPGLRRACTVRLR